MSYLVSFLEVVVKNPCLFKVCVILWFCSQWQCLIPLLCLFLFLFFLIAGEYYVLLFLCEAQVGKFFGLVDRMRLQACGFMDLVHERCLLFLLAHIIASRDRISSLVDFGKVNSCHSILGLLVIQIIIIPKQGSHWNTSSKTLGTLPFLVLRANHQSRLNSYGKTATKMSSVHLMVFQGLVASLKMSQS